MAILLWNAPVRRRNCSLHRFHQHGDVLWHDQFPNEAVIPLTDRSGGVVRCICRGRYRPRRRIYRTARVGIRRSVRPVRSRAGLPLVTTIASRTEGVWRGQVDDRLDDFRDREVCRGTLVGGQEGQQFWDEIFLS